jgi:glycosyltransferase involved in cell wall biosynthesis
MEIKLPKISIVTPSYNQGEFLEKTILSIINQDYKNIEFIVIDGGSSDNSVEIIKKYEMHIDYWVSEVDKGQSDAINKGFERATGDIFYWINSDDFLLPNVLSKIANYNWTKDIGALVGIGHIINLNDVIIYTPDYYEPINTQSLFHWTDGKDFMQPACFFSKNAWNDCGPLNENLYFCMDVDLWINISKKYKINRIKENFAHAYAHEDAKTTAEVDKMKLETYLMVASHGGFDASKKGLFNFFKKNQNKKLSSGAVLQQFSLKKLIKLVFKKMFKTNG